MTVLICALASGVLLFLSTGVGGQWPLAWLATIPVLLLAYGKRPTWQVAIAAFCAYAIGLLNLLVAYGTIIFALAPLLPIIAIAFAGCVVLARYAYQRLPLGAAAIAFPVAWTAVEFINSNVSTNGTYGAFAYSQVPAPLLIQSASLFGLWIVTFLLCLVSNAVALWLRKGREAVPVVIGVAALLVINVGFGYARLAAPSASPVRVGVVSDDALRFGATEPSARAVARIFSIAATNLARHGAKTIVTPEKIAALDPRWTDVTDEFKREAKATGTTIVSGFEEHAATAQNVALTFHPDGTVSRYAKRHLIPGLEALVPGHDAGWLGQNRSVAICKDMDFQATIRNDSRNGIAIMYVPAWDFVTDGRAHANMAIMRGVENGFALVRSARHGLMTVTDAQGRVIASQPSSFTSLESYLADVSPGPGMTLYDTIGDVFAWICVAAAVLIAILALQPAVLRLRVQDRSFRAAD